MPFTHMIQLIAIKPTLDENGEFINNPDCKESLQMSISYYEKIGYHFPWIGYYASLNGMLVGSGGYKGKPVDNKIEIAYGTFPKFQNRGIGTEICTQLVVHAQQTDSNLLISARTLPSHNYSTRILEKNGFKLSGPVIDKEDGEVWEWIFENT